MENESCYLGHNKVTLNALPVSTKSRRNLENFGNKFTNVRRTLVGKLLSFMYSPHLLFSLRLIDKGNE